MVEFAVTSEGIASEVAESAKQAFLNNTPLFLICYYSHESDKLAFLDQLKKSAAERKLMTMTFDPAHREDHAAQRFYPLISEASHSNTFSIIAGLPHEAEQSHASSFLEYINLHRDVIARERLRFILLLHSSESEGFIRTAGDLWDFRHHTYWLPEQFAMEPKTFWRGMEGTARELLLEDSDKAAIQQHMKEVHSLVDRTQDQEEKAGILLDLTRWLRRRNAFPLAVKTALLGVSFNNGKSNKLLGDLENELGFGLHENGHLPEALSHYESSLKIYKERENKAGEWTTLNNISQIYDAWGKYEEALETLQQSLKIAREIGNKTGEWTTLNNISQIYDAWGKYDEALETLQQSLKIAREIGDKTGEGTTLNNISMIYGAWGKYDEALETLQQSLKIAREIGNKAGEGKTLNNISQIYHAWGKYEEALETLKQSLKIRREIGDKAGEGTTLNNISMIYRAWGKYEQAMETLQQSLKIAREIGDKAGEATTCRNLATEWERRGDLTKAVEYAKIAVGIEKELNLPDWKESRDYLEKLERRRKESSKQGGRDEIQHL